MLHYIYTIYILYIYIYYIFMSHTYIYIHMYSGITYICILRDTMYIYIYKRSYIILPNDISTVYRHKISFSQVFESIKVESMIDW